MRTIYAGNWKMNKSKEEVINYVNELKKNDFGTKEVVLFVPSIYLDLVKKELEQTNICVGAQNIYQETNGAFTGEISGLMLKSMGINKVLIGHSERRQYFNENDKNINRKIQIALENDLEAYLCIGETLEERLANHTNHIIEMQVKEALMDISEEQMKSIVIAYEPVWAIGTGETATSEQAQEVCNYIRELIKGLYNEEVANKTMILYGGSVNNDNCSEILAKQDINGVLVGGASLDAQGFSNLIIDN